MEKRPDKRHSHYHTPEWRALRARILKRDRFRCVGADCDTPNQGIGTRLSVDHIVELKAGGTDDESNLRTLCAACHNRRHGYRGGAL